MAVTVSVSIIDRDGDSVYRDSDGVIAVTVVTVEVTVMLQ